LISKKLITDALVEKGLVDAPLSKEELKA